MADTFEKIATVTVGAGGSSTIDFTSIPSTYTDLCLKLSGRGTVGAVETDLYITFNSNTSSYSWKMVQGNGTVASSAGGSNRRSAVLGGSTTTANTFSNIEYYIPNYAGSTNKSVSVDSVYENNGNPVADELDAVLWSNTAAITSITLTPASGNFAQYSTATLYGIKNS